MHERPAWRRLWQPRKGLFWLALTFNALSSGMAWYLNLARPQGPLLWLLTLVALTNAFLGMWLFWRLWSGPGPQALPLRKGDCDVQMPADRQDR
ncbi:MAG: hypothetical protein R3E94_04600 [Burkholderiaceae bacterium]